MLDRLNEGTAVGCTPRQDVSFGALALPRVRIDASRKSAQGVGLLDPAVDLNRQIEAARKEYAHRCGPPPRPLR